MLSPKRSLLIALIAALVAQPGSAGTVVLKKSWIDKYKNRATIDATFTVDHAHPKPNPPAKDGDLHASGRSQEVGLPMVSEVMNAALAGQVATVKALQADQGQTKTQPISGAWRLWFEHPSTQPQTQGDTVPPAVNTNPDHCFEIHPITKYAGVSVAGSFVEVKGGAPYDADQAFASYEKLTLSVAVTDSAVTMQSAKAGYNYVHFFTEMGSARQKLDDGGFAVLGNIMSESQGDVIANNIRMVFVPGTPPALTALQKGEVHLLGIPRVNLNAVAALASKGKGQYKGKLPYEIIVVGVCSGNKCN